MSCDHLDSTENHFEIGNADNVDTLLIRLDDQMADLDHDITVLYHGKPVFTGRARRTLGAMLRTRGDPALMFDAEISIDLPAAPK